MPDPATFRLEEELETERLITALVEIRSDLQRRDAALQTLQGELTASRLEVAGAREETVQFQGLLRRAEDAAREAAAEAAAVERARALLASAAADRDKEITQLHTVIASLQAEASALRIGMDVLRASASWRISAPVRVAGRLMRGIRTIGSPLLRMNRATPPHQAPPVAQLPAALPSHGDPTAPIIFQAAPLVDDPSGEQEPVITLDRLYYLSRAL